MRILLAEDEAVSRRLLETSVKKWGFDPIVVQDGAQAWQILQKTSPPRMAIFDWMMPYMDGVQLCQQIRQHSNLAHTYIILVTGRTHTADVIEGLEGGADDYVTKPFDLDELRTRLQAGQRIVELQHRLEETNKELEHYAEHMEELADARSRQLIHAERMATVGLMAAGIAHEINNPATFIAGNAQTQMKFWEKLEPFLRQLSVDSDQRQILEFILEEMPNTHDSILNGVERISHIVKGLKAFVRHEEGEKTPCNINECVEQSLLLAHNTLKNRVSVESQLDDQLPPIKADAQQIEQILVNLLINAADAIEEHQGSGTVSICTSGANGHVIITVEDDGPGIPPNKLESIWQPFFTTKSADRGTGLGLSIVQGIMEDHNATIEVENKNTGGARFRMRFPTVS